MFEDLQARRAEKPVARPEGPVGDVKEAHEQGVNREVDITLLREDYLQLEKGTVANVYDKFMADPTVTRREGMEKARKELDGIAAQMEGSRHVN